MLIISLFCTLNLLKEVYRLGHNEKFVGIIEAAHYHLKKSLQGILLRHMIRLNIFYTNCTEDCNLML